MKNIFYGNRRLGNISLDVATCIICDSPAFCKKIQGIAMQNGKTKL